MELDKTRISVRERGILDTLDLAVLVFRRHAGPLVFTMFIGALPWAVANHLLLRWMLHPELDLMLSSAAIGQFIRYVWTVALLVTIEAPLASAFTTVYLGKALFFERPPMAEVLRETKRLLPRLAWYHLALRGVLPATALVLAIDRDAMFSGGEVLLGLLLIAVLLRRLTAPFLNEIILLEKNPIAARDARSMTIRKRSLMLHAPSGGNLIALGTVAAFYAVVMACGLAALLYALQGILLAGFASERMTVIVHWPLALWLTAAFFTVVRYLSYLDLRIRQEGWEVELRMRAEAKRLAESI